MSDDTEPVRIAKFQIRGSDGGRKVGETSTHRSMYFRLSRPLTKIEVQEFQEAKVGEYSAPNQAIYVKDVGYKMLDRKYEKLRDFIQNLPAKAALRHQEEEHIKVMVKGQVAYINADILDA